MLLKGRRMVGNSAKPDGDPDFTNLSYERQKVIGTEDFSNPIFSLQNPDLNFVLPTPL